MVSAMVLSQSVARLDTKNFMAVMSGSAWLAMVCMVRALLSNSAASSGWLSPNAANCVESSAWFLDAETISCRGTGTEEY